MRRTWVTLYGLTLCLTLFRAEQFVATDVLETARQDDRDAQTLKLQALAADPAL